MAKRKQTAPEWPAAAKATGHALILEERARANAEKEFHDLLDAAPDAALEIDGRGRIVRANAAVRELFGYTPEELCG